MNRTSLYLGFGAALVAAGVGCQAIANLDSRSVDPPPPAGVCTLAGVGTTASTGNGRVRLVNVANVAGSADFCFRASGTADWGRPIFRDGGQDSLCAGGLAYGQATVPFSVAVGKIDVKAIVAGQTCSATATSEKDGISVGDYVNGTKSGSTTNYAPVITLMRAAGGTSTEGLFALPERSRSESTPPNTRQTRIVNALSDAKTITFGISNNPSLPASVDNPITSPISAGLAATSAQSIQASFPVDANGYVQLLPATISIAASYGDDTSNKAVALFQTPQNADLSTFYVIGDPDDTTNSGHVVRALYCEDSQSAATVTADAGTASASIPAADLALLADCTLSNLPSLSIDMVNAALYGANAPFEQARTIPVENAIAARSSDIMCVVELDDGSSLSDTIKKALNGGQLPYSYSISTSNSTPPTNPNDIKTLPGSAPCGGSVNPTLVSNAFSCVEQNCSTLSGGDPTGSGTLAGTTGCLSGPCIGPLGRLYDVPAPADTSSTGYINDQCFDCILYYLASDSLISHAQTECTTDSNQQPYSFDGQNGSAILSRHPLLNTKSYILPSTGFRRAILKAQVQLEDKSLVDFFCAQLSSPLVDTDLPYTGNYGGDQGTHKNGWEDEQVLQTQEAVAWIQSETAADKLPAIIAADLHADEGNSADAGAAGDAGSTAVADLSPEVPQAFVAAGFIPATPQGYTTQCDYCPAPENPYNSAETPYELMHAYTVGFPKNATYQESFWGNDITAVTITSIPGETATSPTGPVFQYWAHNYQILRP